MRRQPDITYGLASNCFIKTVELNGFVVQYMTPFLDNYLDWMIAELFVDLRAEVKMEAIRASWNRPKRSFCFQGSFNENQYKKVQDFYNSGATEAFAECRIPKVKLKTVYPE